MKPQLRSFYSFKQLTTPSPPLGPPTAPEPDYQAVYTAIDAGHRAYFRGAYQRAIDLYLQAWTAALHLGSSSRDSMSLTPELILHTDSFTPLLDRVASGAAAMAATASVVDENRQVDALGPASSSPRPARSTSPEAATVLKVLVGGEVARIAIGGSDSRSRLLAAAYAPRIEAATAEALCLSLEIPDNRLAYLPHVVSFVLPASLGDAYHSFGDFGLAEAFYLKARDYPYINDPHETELIWKRLAENAISWGDALEKRKQVAEAEVQFKKVVLVAFDAATLGPRPTLEMMLEEPDKTLTAIEEWNARFATLLGRAAGGHPEASQADPIPLGSPLYQGRLQPLASRARNLLNIYLESSDGLPENAYAEWPADLAYMLLRSRGRLVNLVASISWPPGGVVVEAASVFTFRYLQGVARYFAGQLVSLERALVQFQSSADQGRLTRVNLQTAIEIEQQADIIASQRVGTAFLFTSQMNAAYDASNARADRAQRLLTDFQKAEEENIPLAGLQVMIADRYPPDFEMAQEGTNGESFAEFMQEYANSAGHAIINDPSFWFHPPNPSDLQYVSEVLGHIARRRQEIGSGQIERGLRHESDSANENAIVLFLQRAGADTQFSLAREERKLATIRAIGAKQLSDTLENEILTITPEVWSSLAQSLRALYVCSLNRAVGVALLMERAYNMEQQSDLRRIRLNYELSDQTSAGDELLFDIDSFGYDEVQRNAKRIPLRTTISLAERFPVQFSSAFGAARPSGRLDFSTRIEDFTREFPGSYHHRLRAIEVRVEGLVGPAGIRGTLTQDGVTRTRNADGGTEILARFPETTYLSQFDERRDEAWFRDFGEEARVFEFSGAAGAWTLDIPPETNDLVYASVSDVKVILYYDALYSAALAFRDRSGDIGHLLRQPVP